MRIAIASGKGGTGKTTIATSLACSLAARRAFEPPLFLDCDVEGPNAHLFLRPSFEHRKDVAISIPRVDETECTSCGRCTEVCQDHAIVVLGKRILVFPQLCHGCASCTAICPERAITEVPNIMGVLEYGKARLGISFARGVLNVGEPMAVPVIRQLKKWVIPQMGQVMILDAPPGTACPVVETVRGADFILLVTEPRPFGLHDLKLAAQIARELKIPAGVVVNRDGIGDGEVETFCAADGLPILMRIPFDRAIAQGIARGRLLTDVRPEYTLRFLQMFSQILNRASVAT